MEKYQYAQSYVLCFFLPLLKWRVRRKYWKLIICMVPRILVGIVAYYVFRGVLKALGEKKRKEDHCFRSRRGCRIINQYSFGNESDLLIFRKRIWTGSKRTDGRNLFRYYRNYMHQWNSGSHCGRNTYGSGYTGFI